MWTSRGGKSRTCDGRVGSQVDATSGRTSRQNRSARRRPAQMLAALVFCVCAAVLGELQPADVTIGRRDGGHPAPAQFLESCAGHARVLAPVAAPDGRLQGRHDLLAPDQAARLVTRDPECAPVTSVVVVFVGRRANDVVWPRARQPLVQTADGRRAIDAISSCATRSGVRPLIDARNTCRHPTVAAWWPLHVFRATSAAHAAVAVIIPTYRRIATMP